MCYNIFNRAILLNECSSSFRTEPRYTRYIIRCIALQTEHINYLRYIFNVPFLTNLFFTQHIHGISHVCWFVQVHMFIYKLSKIFVRCHHINLKTFFNSFFRQRSDDIIRLKTIHFENWDVKSPDDFLDLRDPVTNIFRCFLTCCFIRFKDRIAKSGRSRIKRHTDVSRFLFL